MTTKTKRKTAEQFGIDKSHLGDDELAKREALAARIGDGDVVIGPSERPQTMWLPDSEKDFFRAAILAGIGTWVGFDWHEPDQCGVDAVVTGNTFDNAGMTWEKRVHLKVDGKRVASVNLATLCALAMSAVIRQFVPREGK